MHRRSRFLIGLAAAAITFASLWFTLGHEQFNRGHKFCQREHHCMMKERENNECFEQTEEHGNKKVIVIKEVIKTDTIKK
jgi:hypothetical protein